MKNRIEIWFNGYNREIAYGSQFIRAFNFHGKRSEAFAKAKAIKDENNDFFDSSDRDLRCGVSVNGETVY